MKKIIYTLSIVLGLGLSANAQVESLAGPRLGAVYITASPASSFLNGTHTLEDLGELLSILPLLEKFEKTNIIKTILVTTTTLSSSKILERKIK